jgi:hypothetical protein
MVCSRAGSRRTAASRAALTLRRALSGIAGTLPNEHKAELVEWLRRSSDDDATFIC